MCFLFVSKQGEEFLWGGEFYSLLRNDNFYNLMSLRAIRQQAESVAIPWQKHGIPTVGWLHPPSG